MATFKFLHTADVHLDSPLRGLARYEGAPLEQLRDATRQAFSGLVDLAIEEDVAFMVIAGDLYDGDWRDYNTGIYFANEMGRLRSAGIRVSLLHGNHDAQSQITRALTLPDNVSVFGTRKAETVRYDDLGAALHGQSFRTRDVAENLVPGYPAPISGMFNIGVLHTALEGHAAHASYAPCSLAELKAKGYDYWALGHVHEYGVLSEQPYVVFPGNLQGRHIRELGAKGAILVNVEDGEVAGHERVCTDVLRWAHVEVEVAGVESLDDCLEHVRDALENEHGRAEARLVATRVVLRGRTPAHPEIVRNEDRFVAEIRAVNAWLGQEGIWVEKIQLETEPDLDPELLRQREDAVGELGRMLDEAATDQELIADLRKELGGLIGALPAELREEHDDVGLAAVREDRLEELIRKIAPALLARISSSGD